MKPMLIVPLSMLLLAGCGRNNATTYEVPKQTGPAPAAEPPASQAMGSASDMAAIQAAHAAMSAQLPDSGFQAKLPAGWTEKPASGMRMASYGIDGTSIDFYLISLAMGDLPSNVNRWRGQVGLSPAPEEEIAAQVAQFEADGHPVSYIEIYNDETGKGIIAAIVDLAPKYWYFTAKGSVDELKANASGIRAFIESLQIH